MPHFTRREVIFTGAALLSTNVLAKGGESTQVRRINASSIPKEVQIVGILGKPLCTLAAFRGEWIVAYDHFIKGDTLHLQIDSIDYAELKKAAMFPGRLIDILYQTTGLNTKEMLQGVQEGDVWTGKAFETAEIDWTPKAVFQLPGVVPWRDGRPKGVVSRLTCAQLSASRK